MPVDTLIFSGVAVGALVAHILIVGPASVMRRDSKDTHWADALVIYIALPAYLGALVSTLV